MSESKLKPCQAIARSTIRWTEDLDGNYFICQTDCPKYEHHAAERIGRGYLDGLVALTVERNVMRSLCKRCTEAPEFVI